MPGATGKPRRVNWAEVTVAQRTVRYRGSHFARPSGWSTRGRQVLDRTRLPPRQLGPPARQRAAELVEVSPFELLLLPLPPPPDWMHIQEPSSEPETVLLPV